MIQIKGKIARTSQPMIILEKTLNSRDPIDWNQGEIVENWKFNWSINDQIL